MFYHTHVYFSKRIDNNLDPLKIIGSFLPDLAITGLITWDDLHKKENILDFFAYVEKNNPKYKSLLEGIRYHNILDYYTHTEYKGSTPGYAYASIPEKLPSLLEKAINVDSKRAIASAHNFMESGVEYYLLQDNPDLESLPKNSIKQIDKEELAKLLAKYYKKDEKLMLEGLSKLFSFVISYDYKTLEGWLQFWIDGNRFYLKKETDLNLAKKALELSFKATKDTYQDFLEYVIDTKDNSIRDAN